MKGKGGTQFRDLSLFIGASSRTPNGVRLVLPLPANVANLRAHWTRKLKLKNSYEELLSDLALDKRFPGPPGRPPRKVLVSVSMYLWKVMDQGNAMARLKFLEDWLVTKGYAMDDSPEHWEYTGLPTQVMDRKWQRVEITIEWGS